MNQFLNLVQLHPKRISVRPVQIRAMTVVFNANPPVQSQHVTISKKQIFLRDLHQVLETHYKDLNLTIEQLSQWMCLSQSHFFRKMKTYTGHNPNSYLRLYRLEKAYTLLEDHDNLSIADVSYEVGFRAPNYFSRAFYKVFGYTPSSLRKRLK